jgi:hypothetical protein
VDCLIEQTVPEEKSSFEVLMTKPKYGFGNQFSDVFKGFTVSFAKKYIQFVYFKRFSCHSPSVLFALHEQKVEIHI